MVFVYKSAAAAAAADQLFALDDHVTRFECYDHWQRTQYAFCQKVRSEGLAGKPDNPVAYFTVDDEWWVSYSRDIH